MRKESRLLKAKSLASLRKAIEAFNGTDDDGRITTVLLFAEHSAEMLIKAALVERKVSVVDKQTRMTLGFKRCVNLAREHLQLTEEAAGTLRTLGALRNGEQHYIGGIDEGILFIHMRALVTLFDDLLDRCFADSLANHLPKRVLPISTIPLEDIDLLIDRQFNQIYDLLKPGMRRRTEARSRIRTLLAMEAHLVDDVEVSERDVSRIEKGLRAGHYLEDVFPRLALLSTKVGGDGIDITVHFSRKGDGAPVTFISTEDPRDAAAIREIDLQKKYHISRKDLADGVGLPTKKAKLLRDHLALDDDPNCCHTFQFGKSEHVRYSDLALRRMREAQADAA